MIFCTMILYVCVKLKWKAPAGYKWMCCVNMCGVCLFRLHTTVCDYGVYKAYMFVCVCYTLYALNMSIGCWSFYQDTVSKIRINSLIGTCTSILFLYIRKTANTREKSTWLWCGLDWIEFHHLFSHL